MRGKGLEERCVWVGGRGRGRFLIFQLKKRGGWNKGSETRMGGERGTVGSVSEKKVVIVLLKRGYYFVYRNVNVLGVFKNTFC